MKKTQKIIQLAIGLISLMAFSCVLAAEVANPVDTSPVHIRTLAASCAVCHGHLGNPVKTTEATQKSLQLAGEDKQKIIERLQSFRLGKAESTVMHHHAKGLTEAEIVALADFFAVQQKAVKTALPHQPYLTPVLQ